MVDVAFVSSNPGKYREARDILRPYGVHVRWLRRSLVEPQSADLAEVARAKAAAVRGVPGYVMVEDSGLFVRSLHGFPGVYSAHFLQLWGFPMLLELLRQRPRAAEFRSVAVLRRGRTVRTFVGEVGGTIAPFPAGRHGFGYDPIFIPEGYHQTFAELPPTIKNAISHRTRAMAKVGAFLRDRETPVPRRARTRSA